MGALCPIAACTRAAVGGRCVIPWSSEQQKVARAVEHGWEPKGSAKGFTRSFADLVVKESPKVKAKKRIRRKYFGIPEE